MLIVPFEVLVQPAGILLDLCVLSYYRGGQISEIVLEQDQHLWGSYQILVRQLESDVSFL